MRMEHTDLARGDTAPARSWADGPAGLALGLSGRGLLSSQSPPLLGSGCALGLGVFLLPSTEQQLAFHLDQLFPASVRPWGPSSDGRAACPAPWWTLSGPAANSSPSLHGCGRRPQASTVCQTPEGTSLYLPPLSGPHADRTAVASLLTGAHDRDAH